MPDAPGDERPVRTRRRRYSGRNPRDFRDKYKEQNPERYPEEGHRGGTIEGLADAERAGALVFHAGTALQGERLVTNGGRILSVTGLGQSLAMARSVAYDAAELISFPGARFRGDIAAAAVAGIGVDL